MLLGSFGGVAKHHEGPHQFHQALGFLGCDALLSLLDKLFISLCLG